MRFACDVGGTFTDLIMEDGPEVRLYKAWYRYLTLAMLALAWLAVTRATLAEPEEPGDPVEY